MAGNTVPVFDIRNSSLQWINNMQLLNDWLDAVATNLGHLCVPCMVHASIAESLAVPKEVVGEAKRQCSWLPVESLELASPLVD
jgi:hypothetical protein